MSDPIIYSIDTSSLMEWQFRDYPTDVFPGLVTKFDELIQQGRLIAPDLVKVEVLRVGSQPMKTWVRSNGSLFVPTQDLIKEARVIKLSYPGMIDQSSIHEEADAYVIALAQIRGATVVTNETSAALKKFAPRSHYIPDVCRLLGVPCIDVLGLMRSETWKF